LQPKNFKATPSSTPTSSSSPKKPLTPTTKTQTPSPSRRLYTPEEDEVLLQFVKDHPKYKPSGISLWKMAEKEVYT
jgi:hypothetical protein